MKAWSRWQDWLNVVVGLYLFLSPWLLGFSAVGSAAWSGWVFGVLVFVVALWALRSPDSGSPEWCNIVLGVVAIAAPWAFGFANLTNPVWSFVVSGVIVLGLSALALREIGASGSPRTA